MNSGTVRSTIQSRSGGGTGILPPAAGASPSNNIINNDTSSSQTFIKKPTLPVVANASPTRGLGHSGA